LQNREVEELTVWNFGSYVMNVGLIANGTNAYGDL
jgi:hypothetical protein